MSKILKKEELAPNVMRFRIHAPRIAKKRKAGQFIILRAHDEGERIPLTIANANKDEEWIEIIFQSVGAGTQKLAALNVGEEISDLAGPLGKPTHIENFGRCLCIGGGVGIAPLYPIVNALKEAGNDVTTILGARSKNILILEDEMEASCDKLLIATDDGSKGHHGFVTDVFKKLIQSGEKYDFAIVIGPAIMMKFTSQLTIKSGIDTFVSLNPIMIDGTGMCGGCRVTVDDETRFACVDGPEFNAANIAWDELLNRLGTYKKVEEKHNCRVGK